MDAMVVHVEPVQEITCINSGYLRAKRTLDLLFTLLILPPSALSSLS